MGMRRLDVGLARYQDGPEDHFEGAAGPGFGASDRSHGRTFDHRKA